MKNRNEPTVVANSIQCIDGYEKVYKKLQQQVTLRGQSRSTLENYVRRIALISLHFGKLPDLLSDNEINEYLTAQALSAKSPSRSSFKHAVYGLCYYFRLIGQNKRAISLPSIKEDTRLPVILNRSELKELFRSPTLLKHRIVLTLIYSAGLENSLHRNINLTRISNGYSMHCCFAVPRHLADIKKFAFIAEISAIVTIVAETVIVLNASHQSKHFGWKIYWKPLFR